MPTGRLAVWWIIASEIVIFGGLLELVDVEFLFVLHDLEGLGFRLGHLVHDLF